MGELHVVPDSRRGGWKIIGEPAGIPAQRIACQIDAIQAACDALHRADGGEVLIHGVDGTAQDRRTVNPAG